MAFDSVREFDRWVSGLEPRPSGDFCVGVRDRHARIIYTPGSRGYCSSKSRLTDAPAMYVTWHRSKLVYNHCLCDDCTRKRWKLEAEGFYVVI